MLPLEPLRKQRLQGNVAPSALGASSFGGCDHHTGPETHVANDSTPWCSREIKTPPGCPGENYSLLKRNGTELKNSLVFES